METHVAKSEERNETTFYIQNFEAMRKYITEKNWHHFVQNLSTGNILDQKESKTINYFHKSLVKWKMHFFFLYT